LFDAVRTTIGSTARRTGGMAPRRGGSLCDHHVRHHEHVSDTQQPAARPGWIRDVQVPRALTDLHGPTSGTIGLPASLFWSGPHPREVRWDIADLDRRRDLYEIVLVEGNLDDITRLIDGPGLVEVWDRMYLPRRVRSAWRPLIDNARAAA
jgi:hypothetical protein